MIVLDRDVLAKVVEGDQTVIQHLQQYSDEEWTLPALVAWETYESRDSRTGMRQDQNYIRSNFDRIIDFSDDTAFEAAYLDAKLRSQDVVLDPTDLLHLGTAHAEGGTFITHNKNNFDKPPVHSLTDVDVVYTE